MLDKRPYPKTKVPSAAISSALEDLRNRWPAGELYGSALFIFFVSRLVVFIGIRLGSFLAPNPGSGHWDAGPFWYDKLLRWDSGLFAGIIRDGYANSVDVGGSATTGSFPLYPLLSYGVQSLLGVDEYVALLLVSNVAALTTALLIAKFFKDELGKETALLSVAFFWFFPSSIFLSAGYSESLFLALVLLSFVLLRAKRFVFAAVAAGLSLGTRPVGLAMLPAVLWDMWREDRAPTQILIPKMIVCGLLALSGLLGFIAFLAFRFGDPFAFLSAQSLWHEPLLDRLLSWSLFNPFRHVNIRIGGWFFCFAALTIWSFWKLRTSVSLYGLGVLMVPYVTVGITDSADRFVMPCFPAFMCLGILCRKHPIPAIALIAVFAALLLRNSALFSQWYWIG